MTPITPSGDNRRKLTGATATIEDGRIIHTMRQSWLGTVLGKCAEQARRELAGILPRVESDAASLGTSVHAAIEATLLEVQESGSPLLLEDAIEVMHRQFDEQLALPNFKWTKLTEASCRRYGEHAVTGWYNEVLPELQPQHMELSWGPFVVYEDVERVVRLTGTVDYVDAASGMWDWKTASRAYEKWKFDRFAIQPTVYTWAWKELTGDDTSAPFTYCVMVRNGSIQRFTVQRDASHWGWLAEQCAGIARLIEADLPVWPQNDQHALCSELWCPAFNDCKGKYL